MPKLVLSGDGILKKSKSTINKSEWWIWSCFFGLISSALILYVPAVEGRDAVIEFHGVVPA